jgi:hypothetical protein
MTQDTNNALDTLNTLSSGATAPGSPEAGQLWHDTTNNILKLRSADNTTWIAVTQFNESAYASAPANSPTGTNDRLNRLINGAMTIDQVNEGASYAVGTGGSFVYTLDQWQAICKSSTASGIIAQQVSDAPAGFANSLKITVGTGASSVASVDILQVAQPIEGFNLNDLGFGSVSAIPVSLSFWVKSSIAGTYSVLLANSGGARTYVTTCTIASAGVWQKITLPNIPGDQSGTWPTNNTQSLSLTISMAAGTGSQTSTLNAWQGSAFLASNTQTNTMLTTTGATFQITGVMLNSGSFAQPFEKRTIQQELLSCERYYEKSFPQGTAVAQNAGLAGCFTFPQTLGASAAGSFATKALFRTVMRTVPTVTLYNPAAANGQIRNVSNSLDWSSSTLVATFGADANGFTAQGTTPSGTGVGNLNGVHFTASARM